MRNLPTVPQQGNPQVLKLPEYRRDLDGLRGLAVLMVLVYHARLGLEGGYVGVDLFFVVSGFLITKVVIRDIRAGAFSFKAFCERRIRRLLPALAAMTLVVSLLSPLFLMPSDLENLGKVLLAQPFLAANCVYWVVVKIGYFGKFKENWPLLHTWSLSVEEQFYLGFPWVLVWVETLRRRQIRGDYFLVALTLASFLLSLGLSASHPEFSFFMLPTRIWEMLSGALLVTMTRKIRLQSVLSLLGLALICVSAFLFRPGMVFPGWAALVPVLGTCLFIVGGSRSPAGRVLSVPLFVGIGRISYSLYLWHWPCFSLAAYCGLLRHPAVKLGCLAASFLLGYCSWRWIETPLRRSQSSLIWVILAFYCAGCIFLGGLFWGTGGLPSFWPRLPERPTRSFVVESELSQDNAGVTPLGFRRAEKCFLLWGDSHAMSIAPVLDELGKQHRIAGLQLTHSAFPPLVKWRKRGDLVSNFELQKRWSESALQTIQARSISKVFLVGCWDFYEPSILPQAVSDTVGILRNLGIETIFLQDVPIGPDDPLRAFGLFQRFPALNPEPLRRCPMVSGAFLGLPSVQIVDPAPLLLSLTPQEAASAYIDDDHLSDDGARRLRPLLAPYFRKWAGN